MSIHEMTWIYDDFCRANADKLLQNTDDYWVTVKKNVMANDTVREGPPC